MGYQPAWIGGQEHGRAERDCATRYEAIRQYLQVFGPDQGQVLDFGAAEGYFTARLAEDFPGLLITAVDDNRHLRRNLHGIRNARAIQRRVAPAALEHMLAPPYRPDVVLLLSVLHHLVDWPVLLQAVCDLGAEVLFVELAEPEEDLPRAVAHEHTADMHAVLLGMDAEIIAETAGYRSDAQRKLYVVDLRAADLSATQPNSPAPTAPVLDPLGQDGYEHPKFPTTTAHEE